MGAKRLGRIGDPVLRAQIAESLRAVRAEVPREAGPGSLQLHRLKTWIRALACSVNWEDSLLEAIRSNLLPLRGSRSDQESALRDREVYPPGGDQTLMVRCTCCRRFCPPKPSTVHGWFCLKCVGPPEDVAPDPARSHWRRQCGWEKRRCEGCCTGRKLLYARDMRLLPICADCNSDWMSNRQILMSQSSFKGFTWTIRNSEAKAYLASGILRRSSRRIFRALDPRVGGGHVDEEGVLHDPYLGSSAIPETVEVES